MDPATKLRDEFAARQHAEMRSAHKRQRRNRFGASLAGGVAALAAVALTAALARQTIVWHAFGLEAALGALAGYLLARRGGGMLAGALYFCLAYLVAFQLRSTGFDPGSLFAGKDMQLAWAGSGHLMSLGILVSCGGIIGLGIEN